MTLSFSAIAQDPSNCTFDQTTPIPDGGFINLPLTISGATNNDLSNPGQGVCGVILNFKHDFVCDLSMQLTSPSGQTVELIGQPSDLCNPTNATWLITLVPCNHPEWTNPDPSISSFTWSNTAGWSTGLYTGAYFPVNGNCLEDFNSGTVNGTWTLSISDAEIFYTGNLFNYTILFCDDSGLDCSVCEANAGDLSSYPDVTACQGDESLHLSLTPSYTPITAKPDSLRYGYRYVVSQNGIIENYINNPNFSNYPVGQYTVCGLSYRLSDIGKIPDPNGSLTVNNLRLNLNGNNPLFCGEITDDCINITIIQPINTIFIRDTICQGECVQVSDTSICQTGNYTIHRSAAFNCDSIFSVNILVQPTAVTNLTSIVCQNDCVDIGTSSYCNSGIYSDTLTNQYGCDSIINLQLTVLQANANLPIFDTLTCVDTLIQLDASLSTIGANITYHWEALDGTGIVGSNDQNTCLVNQPGFYRFIVMNTLSGTTCSDTAFLSVIDLRNIPTATATGGTLNCTFDSLNLNVITNAISPQFQWQGTNFSSSIQSPRIGINGLYNVIVTDIFGCSNSSSVQVDIDTIAPNASAIGDTITCSVNQTIQLHGDSDVPNSTYEWYGTGFASDLQNPIVTNVGTYQMINYAPNGCTDTVYTEVIANDSIPQFTLQADTLTCSIQQRVITLSPQANDYTYQWLGPGFSSALQSPTVTQAGNYIVTVTGTNSCTAIGSITIFNDTLPPVFTFTAADTITCINTMIGLSIQTVQNIVQFSWTGVNGYTSVASQPNDIVNEGWYYLTVMGDNGCTANDSIFVDQNIAYPNLAIQAEDLSCKTDSVQLQLIGTQLIDYQYEWTSNSGFQSNVIQPFVSQSEDYFLAVTPSNGCVYYDTFTVGIDTLLPNFLIQVTPTTLLNCDTNTTQIRIVPNNGNIDVFTWTFPSGSQIHAQSVIVGAGGWYISHITGSNGCVASDSVFINADDALPNIFTNGNSITCTTDSVQIFGGSSTPNVTYHWSGPGNFLSDNQNPFVIQQGTYYLTVTSENGCEAVATSEVLADSITINISTYGDTLICNQLFGQIGVSTDVPTAIIYWYDPNGFQFSNNANPIITQPGLYTVLVEDNDCSVYGYANVIHQNNIPNISVIADTITCLNTQATLTGNSTTNNVDYQWFTINNVVVGDTNLLSTTQAGFYIFQVSDALGCIAIDTVEVVADAQFPNLQLNGNPITCLNDTITLTAETVDSNLTYTWILDNSTLPFSDSFINVSVGGNYFVRVESQNGCISTDSFLVTYDTLPPLVIASVFDTITCTNSSVTIFGYSPDNNVIFEWMGPNNFFATLPETSAPVSGLYILTGTAQNGCFSADSINVIADASVPILQFSIETISCTQNTATIFVTSNTPLDTIRWIQNGTVIEPNNDSIVVNVNGQYTVEILGQNGCPLTTSVNVEIDTITPMFSIHSDTITCSESQAVLIATSIQANLFTWFDSSNNPLINNDTFITNQAGVYYVVATATNGCTSSATTTVINNDTLPQATIVLDTIRCNHPQATITAQPIPSQVNYEWFNNTGQLISQNQTLLIVNSGNYRLRITALNGCSNDYNFNIPIFNIPPIASAATDTITCLQTFAQLTATSPTATIFEWYNNVGTLISNQAVDTVFSAGQYTLMVEDANGCRDTVPVIVVENTAPPTIDFTITDITCLIDSVQILTQTTPQNVSFIWSGVGGYNSTNPDPFVQLAGKYFVTITSSNTGCVLVDSVTINANVALPEVILSDSIFLNCNSPITQISANIDSDFIIQWQTNSGNIIGATNIPKPFIDREGWYYVSVQNTANGCITMDSVRAFANYILLNEPILQVIEPDCEGFQTGAITVQGQGGTPPYSYALNSDVYSNFNTFNYLAAGNYQLFIRDSVGCILDTVVTIKQPNGIDVSLGEDKHVKYGEQVQLLAQVNILPNDIDTIVWIFPTGLDCTNCLNPNLVATQTISYTVRVTNIYGCWDEDDVLITVFKDEPVYIPNVFTPNNDGFNDVFMLFSNENVQKVNYLSIFTRWGAKVFEEKDFLPNDPTFGWDGKLNNELMNPAVFVYLAEITMTDGTIKFYKGDLTLIR